MKNRNRSEVSLLLKVFTILIFGFMLKVLISCKPNFPDPIEISYNKIELSGVDNSRSYLSYNNISTDTMFAEAVAFALIIKDTSDYLAASFLPNLIQSFSFQTLKADSYGPIYVPKHKVVNIKVSTLLDINSSVKAGADITQDILYAATNRSGLYKNLGEGIAKLNSFYDYKGIVLVLKSAVENTQAQLEVEVTLDTGSKLKCSSKVFTIIKP